MKPPARPLLGIDASRVSADRAGIDNYVHHLLPGLVRGWRDAGGEVVVFSADPAVAAHVDPPVRVIPGGGTGWTQVRLVGAARRAGLDAYFTPIPVLPLLVPMPCVSVVTVQDLLEFRPRWWYFRRLIGHALARAGAVVCISQATEQEVAAEFPGAVGKLHVVHLAADSAVFREAPGELADADAAAGRALLARLGAGQAPVVAVGTIQPRKNYRRLIEAYARVKRQQPGIPPLLIVGRRGWEFEEILELPARLDVAGDVLFAGHLEDAEVAAVMRAAVLLAAVSTGEGFGLPLVEAMYSGLPILAADIPPFREVAGNAALFVNPLSVDDIAAGLGRLLRDEPLRRQLVEVARGRRAIFSWERASTEVGSAIRRALAARNP